MVFTVKSSSTLLPRKTTTSLYFDADLCRVVYVRVCVCVCVCMRVSVAYASEI